MFFFPFDRNGTELRSRVPPGIKPTAAPPFGRALVLLGLLKLKLVAAVVKAELLHADEAQAHPAQQAKQNTEETTSQTNNLHRNDSINKWFTN